MDSIEETEVCKPVFHRMIFVSVNLVFIYLFFSLFLF